MSVETTAYSVNLSSSVDNVSIKFSANVLSVKLAAKGNLLSHTGTAPVVLAVGGTNGQVLKVDSTAASGLAWGSVNVEVISGGLFDSTNEAAGTVKAVKTFAVGDLNNSDVLVLLAENGPNGTAGVVNSICRDGTGTSSRAISSASATTVNYLVITPNEAALGSCYQRGIQATNAPAVAQIETNTAMAGTTWFQGIWTWELQVDTSASKEAHCHYTLLKLTRRVST